jgi:hypothetical protein
MRCLLFTCIATGVVVILTGCGKHPSSVLVRDACDLISKEEVQSVQGSSVNDTNSSERTDDVFRIAQCFYATAESNKSVNLALVQERSDQQTKRSPKEFWKEKFDRYNSKSRDSSTSLGMTEENEKGMAPKKIADLGHDAYWVSNRFGGVLYVLKGDVFISIGLGGTDDEETKLKKSKELAQKALQRL